MNTLLHDYRRLRTLNETHAVTCEYSIPESGIWMVLLYPRVENSDNNCFMFA